MISLVYATTNKFKLAMANMALADLDINLLPLPSDTPEVDEIQADAQELIAVDKARKYFALLKQPLVVMDSGLFIEALNGFPGPYTKFALDTIGVSGLSALASNVDNKTAYTQRTIVYIDDSSIKTVIHKAEGKIISTSRGNEGRDYDFIFEMNASKKTLAELDASAKAEIASAAWRELGSWIKDKQ